MCSSVMVLLSLPTVFVRHFNLERHVCAGRVMDNIDCSHPYLHR